MPLLQETSVAPGTWQSGSAQSARPSHSSSMPLPQISVGDGGEQSSHRQGFSAGSQVPSWLQTFGAMVLAETAGGVPGRNRPMLTGEGDGGTFASKRKL